MNQNPKIKDILLRTKSRSLDIAVMKLISLRKKEKGEYDWHLGVSSSNIAMFDIDEVIPVEEAIKFAERLRKFISLNYEIDNKIIIIRTNHGYHIVSDASLTEKEWLNLYNTILDTIIQEEEMLKLHDKIPEKMPPLDKAHIELSIKYKSTTLRLTPKYGKDEIYKVIGVI